MASRDMIGSERPGRPGPRLQAAAVLALVLVCVSWWVAAEGAALAKRNTTFGSCMGCRIEEDLELEMLLVEEVYYATVHVDRMLATEGGGTGTGGTGDSGQGTCSNGPGQQKDCSPSANQSKKQCGNQYNRDCPKPPQ